MILSEIKLHDDDGAHIATLTISQVDVESPAFHDRDCERCSDIEHHTRSLDFDVSTPLTANRYGRRECRALLEHARLLPKCYLRAHIMYTRDGAVLCLNDNDYLAPSLSAPYRSGQEPVKTIANRTRDYCLMIVTAFHHNYRF